MEQRMAKMETRFQKLTLLSQKATEPVGLLEKFAYKKWIPGFIGNVIFFVHNEKVEGAEFTVNDRIAAKFESEMVIEICQHLMLNGIKASQIQVISNGDRRLNTISRKLMLEERHSVGLIPLRLGDAEVQIDGTTKIAVVDLVKTDPNWTDPMLPRTILAGVNSCSDGIIVIAHFSLIIEAAEELWEQLISKFVMMGALSHHLELFCGIHKVECSAITSGEDIRLASPSGGCLAICTEKLCGHVCRSVCHPLGRNHDVKRHYCQYPCKEKCPQGHRCQNACWERCACEEGCGFLKACGHPADHQSNLVCSNPCEAALPCGHVCEKTCHKKDDPDHLEPCLKRCQRRCRRKIHACYGRKSHSCSTPCAPCTEICEIRLPCGHTFEISCLDPKPNLENYVCEKKCIRLFALCNHPCKKKCNEECGVCEDPYPRKHPKCGHMVNAPCHVPVTVQCLAQVPPVTPAKCGHTVLVPCNEAGDLSANAGAQYCTQKCDTVLDKSKRNCGHYCDGSCRTCLQGRFHRRCKMPCQKYLICGHECQIGCPLVCPPCNQKCMNVCEHYECPYECGVPCDFVCEHPCSYECPHLKCTKNCGELCDREGCSEPCPLQLPCGHPCVGFCGEICPKLCRICNPKELLEGTFLGQAEVEEEDRFIFLPNCGHTIEEASLRAWLETATENWEIRLKSCPLCRKHVIGLRRFSALVIANLKEVNEVRRHIYGNEVTIADLITSLRDRIRARLEQTRPVFRPFAEYLLRILEVPLKSKLIGGGIFHSMYKDKAGFTEWVCKIWEVAEDLMTLVEHLWPIFCVQNFGRFYDDLFGMLISRPWPLHPNEISSLGRELHRIRDAKALYSRLSLENEEPVLKLAYSQEGRQRFMEANAIIRAWAPYNRARRSDFKAAFALFMELQSYTLEITDDERLEILNAFGSRTGRWFKCPNGHVYVVTECGGVTEMGQCNECGATIGGVNHVVLSRNYLATEMDGAEIPLYPTALQR